MGTNYYARIEQCPVCKRGPDKIHLGLSSAGWKFLFQFNGGQYYKSIEEMKTWLQDKKIYDEYEREISQDVFWKLVESKQELQDPEEDKYSMLIDGYKFQDTEFS